MGCDPVNACSCSLDVISAAAVAVAVAVVAAAPVPVPVVVPTGGFPAGVDFLCRSGMGSSVADNSIEIWNCSVYASCNKPKSTSSLG